jgi:hypothetical protein
MPCAHLILGEGTLHHTRRVLVQVRHREKGKSDAEWSFLAKPFGRISSELSTLMSRVPLPPTEKAKRRKPICHSLVMFSVETFPFLELSLAIIAANYLFENYIRWRQYSRMFASARPALLTDEIVSEVDFQSAQAYSRDKLSFAFFKDAFENIISVAVLFYTVLPLAWTWSGQALAYVGMDDSHEINKSVVFCFGLMWFNMLIDIPFRLYSAFVIEEKHGFNKQTIGLWCTGTFIFIETLIFPSSVF